MNDFAADLFAWAERRPLETVVVFETRKRTLARWHELRKRPLAYYDRAEARLRGALPPAPILAFPDRHPASPGAYSPDTTGRARA